MEIFRKVLADLKKDFADARKAFREQRAETKRKRAEATRELAEAARELGEVRRHLFRIGLSLSNFLYQTVRDRLLAKLSPKVRHANLFWDTALKKANEGEMEEAIDLLTRVSDVFRRVGSVEKTVRCSDDLFWLHIEVGQEAEALTVCESLIEFLSGRIFDRNLADGYQTVGNMFRLLGSWTKGAEYFHRAKRMLEEDGLKNYALLLDFQIAKELRRTKKYNEAIGVLTTAIDSLKQEKNYQRSLGLFYMLLTAIYRDLNDFDKASEVHELAKDWLTENGYHDLAALEASDLYNSMGDADKAIASLQEYIRLTGDDWREQRSSFSKLGEIFLAKGNDVEAKKYFGLSVDTLETVRQKFSRRELRSSFLEKACDDYHQMIMTSLQLNDSWTSLNYLELLKSRALVDMISEKARLPLLDSHPSEVNAISSIVSVEKCIEQLSQHSFDKTVLIFLLPSEDKTVTFVVRQLGTKIEVSHIISRYGFTDLMVDVDLLEELSRGAPSEALDAFLDITLEKLYAELFALVEPYLPEQTEKITFIPYSGFHLLPLHAMFTEHNGRREYLIDKYLVTYAPSVKILKHCELLERSRNGKVFVAAANPRKDLRYSPQEAQNVAALFGTQVNEKSRRQDIVYDGRNAHVFHYTGHGNGQALILHGDGHDSDEDVFEAADVFATLDLPHAWLVTLSACETGKVKLGKTDEYIGLPSAFIHAGAATVISSLWCVSDRSTSLLMRKMYELIRCGSGKAESLREAQLWLRDLHTSDDQMQELMGLVPGIGESPKDVSRFSRTRTSAATLSVEDLHKPYYWAGFICTGAP